MPDSDDTSPQDRKFVSWVLGINAVLVVSGITVVGSILWNQNVQLIKLQSSNDSLVNAMTAMQAQVAAGTQGRYTSEQAAADRNAASTLINANAVRVESMGERLRQLENWKAKVEDRIGHGGS
jgi:hypothetical protein